MAPAPHFFARSVDRADDLPAYAKWHEHLVRNILLDVVLLAALIVGGVKLADALFERSEKSLVYQSGTGAMTHGQLVNHLKIGYPNRNIYWLGPQSGASYATDSMDPNSFILTYLSGGQDDLKDVNKPQLTVVSYGNVDMRIADGRPARDAGSFTQLNSRGDEVYFDEDQMNFATVTLKSNSNVVVINYPLRVSSQKMLDDSLKLTLVK